MTPVLRYSASSNLFGLFSAASLQREARRIGFEWDDRGFCKSPSPYRAIQFAQYADQTAKRALRPYLQAVRESQATDSILEIPAPAGLAYMPFQKAGIAYASRRMNTLLGDEPGLGKTIQAIGLANYLGLEKLLVVCPAGLRLNWTREIEKWHLRNPGVDVLLDGKSEITRYRSTVVSYDLAVRLRADLMSRQYDLVVLDEGHYLKRGSALRTKTIFGDRRKSIPGIISNGKRVLFLTGTPLPNHVGEVYSSLRNLAPECIDNMNSNAFVKYYAIIREVEGSQKVVGIR